MKNNILYTLAIVLINSTVLFSQKIAWQKAPLNPVTVYHTKNHYNLKGPVKEMYTKDNIGYTTHLFFNEAGFLTKKITTNSGNTFRKVFSYSYNTQNQLTKIESGFKKHDKDPDYKPRIEEFTYNNEGLISRRQFISSKQPSEYFYENRKLVKATNDGLYQSNSFTYKYDSKDRLIEQVKNSNYGEIKIVFNYEKKENSKYNIKTTVYKDGTIMKKGIYALTSIDRQKSIGIYKNPEEFTFNVKGYRTYNPKYIKQYYDQYENLVREFSFILKKDFSKTEITYYNNIKSEEQKEEVKLGCISGNCENGYGEFVFNTGAKVYGFFVNKKLNGRGIITFKNGDVYSGNFLNGLRDGYGWYKWHKTNKRYYGHWKKNKRNGYGSFTFEGSYIEAGIYNDDQLITNLFIDFKNKKNTEAGCIGNCSNGFGKIFYANGDKYIGFFKDKKPYKYGRFDWKSYDSFFVGDFDDKGSIHYGTYSTKSYFYAGETINGRLTGKAWKHDKDLKKDYYGEFKEGKLIVDYSDPNVKVSNVVNNYSTPSKTTSYNELSSNTTNFLNLYKKGRSEQKIYLKKLQNSFVAKGLNEDQINEAYKKMTEELYYKDKEASFELLMNVKLPNNNASKIMAKLKPEIKTYIRQKAKKELSSYSGAHSNTK